MAGENEFVRNLLISQRQRAVGTIMGHIERHVARNLTAHQQSELRTRVIGAINAYHDLCLDVLKSSVSDGSIVVNEDALRLLTEIHEQMTRD